VALGLLMLATPAGAESMPGSGETLSLSVASQGIVGEPLAITASGIADGTHHLVVYGSYIDEGPARGAACTAAQDEGAEALTPSGGDVLPSGSFETHFAVVPRHECDYFVSAYLEAAGSRYADAWAFECVSFWEETSPGAWAKISCYVPLVTPLELRSLEEETQRVTEEAEARRAAARHAEELQNAQAHRRELEALAAAEQAEREAAKRNAAHAAHCHVPALVGHTLEGARRLLKAADCRLGRVTLTRDRHATARVRGQSPSPHRLLAAGAAIAVTIGR